MKTLLLAFLLSPQDSEFDRVLKDTERALRDFGQKAERWFREFFELEKPPPKKVEPPVRKEPEKKRTFAFPDPYENWNGYGEGTNVEFEMEAGGTTMRIVKTLDAKGAERHTLKTIVTMNKIETPGEEPVIKNRGLDGKCPQCQKAHKELGTWSLDKVAVDGKEIECALYTSPEKDCKGNAVSKTRTWYSNDVPGGIVRLETNQFKMKLLRYALKRGTPK